MVGTRINSETLEKIKNFLDFEGNNDLLNIYLSLLSIGNGTLGQISSLTGLDYITVRKLLEELILLGYVKKIGKIPRYYALEPFLESIKNKIDESSQDLILSIVEKKIDATPLTLIDNKEMFVQYVKSGVEEQKQKLIQKYANGDQSDLSKKNELEDSIENLITTVTSISFDLIKEAENKGKQVMKKAISSALIPALQYLSEVKTNVDIIYEASRGLDIEEKEIPTDILFGESAVLSMMKDLILRTKSNINILMPKPEIQSLILIANLVNRKRVKASIVGNFEKCPKSVMERLKPSPSTIGTVTLRQSKEITTWAVIRDSEEIVFAPDVNPNDLMVGIWVLSETPGLEQLIQQFSTEIRTLGSKARNISL